ncbi:MAG: sigma-70 family RNA polymerase sigma factor [Planctomycetes bacterium]|nr:sigma-70 family RNA polymerase sigma factor [Planctomycetota bacterium]
MNPISRDLIDRASNGDPAAVDTLLEKNLPGLEAYIRLRTGRLLKARESASDLVQSVCREVLQHMDRYQYRGEAQFRHWLYTTAMRKIVNRYEYYRAEKRDAGREVAPHPDDASGSAESAGQILQTYRSFITPSRHMQAREELDRTERAFAKLSEDKREVVLLAKVVGLSRADIAAEMGRTEIAIRSLLSRALAELSEHLEDSAD